MREDQLSLLLLLALGAVAFMMLTRTSAPQVAMQRYVNEEAWQIERDSRGYISNVVIHRDASTN
jgi:hypothetical protein